VADPALLWQKALAGWPGLAAADVAGVCIAADPYIPELARQVRSLQLWDWRQGALAASRHPALPWDGDDDSLPKGCADLALIDLDVLHGRASFEQAVRGAISLLRPGGRLLVRGGNQSGVGGAARRLREWFGEVAPVAYGGGHRVLVATRGERSGLPATPEAGGEDVVVAGVRLRLLRTPGVFAEGMVDAGTRLLAEWAADTTAGARACDLGCATGVLGLVLLARGASRCSFCDEDLRALAGLRRNLAANGVGPEAAAVYPVDATGEVPGGPYDLVVCNPPFHQGTTTTQRLTESLVRAGWAAVAPGGLMAVVGMRFLPLDRWLPQAEEVAAAGGYRVLAARRRRREHPLPGRRSPTAAEGGAEGPLASRRRRP
jgi:16S rRNA (guanine1207-N2)-methyltransferase